MLGSKKEDKSPSQRATTPPKSSEVASGVGYAYNIHSVPTGMPHQARIPHPWGMYAHGPHPAPLPYAADSNDSEGFLAHMASLGIPPPPPGQLHQQSPSFGNHPISKAQKCPEIDTRAASPPPTRERFSYTRYQVELLNGIFMKIRYPNSMQKQLIAKRVGIKRDQVKIWFQNRRRKDVVGKTTAKDDDSERKMVKDDVLASVVKELESYTDDPKGRKIKEAVRPSERKGKRPARNSSPLSDDLNQSKSPIHIAPAIDNIISEPYQPNCMAFPAQSTPQMLMPLSEPLHCIPGMPFLPNSTHPKQPVTTTSVLTKPCVPIPKKTTLPSSSPNNKDLSKSDSLLNSVLDAMPPPVVGQSTAKPVVSSPKTSDEINTSKSDNVDADESKNSVKAKILTELSPIDESSNDSHFSRISAASPLSEAGSEDSLHDSSGSKSALQIDLSAQGQSNDVNTSSGSLKRPRSDDSDEEEEPPKKRQEVLPEYSDGIVPPNKVAPPSEPLKFDFSLMRPQMGNQIHLPVPMSGNITQDPDRRPTSPVLLGPPQSWTGWPGMPNPGMLPPTDCDYGQYNPYIPPLPMPNQNFKSPCGPELPWPPMRDMPPFPAPNFNQPPWELALSDPGPELKNAGMGDQGFFPPDHIKSMMFGGNVDDSVKSGPMPIHRPEPLHSWMLPSYPNPYTNFGAPPMNSVVDRGLKV